MNLTAPVTHPIWEKLLSHTVHHRFSLFAANAAVAHAAREYTKNRSEKVRLISELRQVFMKFEDVIGAELTNIMCDRTTMSSLYTVSDVNALIKSGKRLHIAGDESVLTRLNKGVWIGGTTPYFLTPEGGVMDRKRLFVTELPECVTDTKISLVSSDQLPSVPGDAPENGFSLVILPGMSEVLTAYALHASHLPRIYEKAVVGWVAGVHLSETGTAKPKVVNGMTGEISDDRLVVLHATLPAGKLASIGLVNVFERGTGDTFVFDKTGFSGAGCQINGKARNFFDYVKERNIDLRLPLVTSYSGEMVNVSFHALDEASHSVKFYAPVLALAEYWQAAPIFSYRLAFASQVAKLSISPDFSCNCILNYLYGELEKEQNIPIGGPATFGEISHVLLNQTMVFMTIKEP
jgi:hypothetical protein